MRDYCKYQQRLFTLPAPMVASEHPLIADLYEFLVLLPKKELWLHTFFGIKCQAEKLQRQGQHQQALNVLIEGLSHAHFWVGHSQKWWQLMAMTVHLIQDHPSHEFFHEPLPALQKLLINAPQPWQGHDVAYCFAQMSLWSFELDHRQMAIDHAKSAVFAEPQWGYAEYLLGWYGLTFEGIDPATHFSRALKTNGGLFEHFLKDPLCQRFPHIFQQTQHCSG